MSLHLLLEVITEDHNILCVVADSARVGAASDVGHIADELASAKIRKLFAKYVEQTH